MISGGRRRPAGVFLVALVMTASLANAVLAQEQKDTSGTNPAVITTTLSLSNEYRFLPGGDYYDQMLFRFTQPFADGKAGVRLTLPLDATNAAGNGEFGIGDISAKVSWIPYVSRQQAFVLSGEIYAPTASQDVLGTGKWVAAPGITWAWFASREIIIAPAYIQNFSFAGDGDRANVNRGDFDLYAVYRPQGKRWWLTSDLTVSHDFEADATPMTWEIQLGWNVAQLNNGAAVNAYVRPGVGIGRDRPYDANIEAGISLVNF